MNAGQRDSDAEGLDVAMCLILKAGTVEKVAHLSFSSMYETTRSIEKLRTGLSRIKKSISGLKYVVTRCNVFVIFMCVASLSYHDLKSAPLLLIVTDHYGFFSVLILSFLRSR